MRWCSGFRSRSRSRSSAWNTAHLLPRVVCTLETHRIERCFFQAFFSLPNVRSFLLYANNMVKWHFRWTFYALFVFTIVSSVLFTHDWCVICTMHLSKWTEIDSSKYRIEKKKKYHREMTKNTSRILNAYSFYITRRSGECIHKYPPESFSIR